MQVPGLYDEDCELEYVVKGQPSFKKWVKNLEITLGGISGSICLSIESKVSHGNLAFKVKIIFVYTIHGALINCYFCISCNLFIYGTSFLHKRSCS